VRLLHNAKIGSPEKAMSLWYGKCLTKNNKCQIWISHQRL